MLLRSGQNTYSTIRKAMLVLFNKKVSATAWYFPLTNGTAAIWFPQGPRKGNETYTLKKDQQWLNIISDDLTELTEVCVAPSLDKVKRDHDHAYNQRILFLKVPKQGYTFMGVFEKVRGTTDHRSRLYRRIEDRIKSETIQDLLP